jgi:NitT/TauT family transport system ATP-binding protein
LPPFLLAFRGVGKRFPDGTVALGGAGPERRPGRVRQHPGAVGLRQQHPAAGGRRAHPGQRRHGQGRPGKVGYLFQDPTLLPWRTVRQNVELLAELRGKGRQERARLAQDAIDLVGLTGFEGHYPRSLSGGMRMRCSLARTLALRPPVFLFDEPFGAVDEITREHLNEQTLALFETEGFAGLFITHSVAEAVFMSTRVIVMSPRPGRVVAEFAVPFEYPRSPELRFDPDFALLSGDISKALRGGNG